MSASSAAQNVGGTSQDSTSPEGHRRRTILNWVLAALLIPGALAVVGYAYLQVLGTARCTSNPCTELGPNETTFGLILYGTPAVAVLAVAVSAFTARRRWGIVVPALGWALLAAAAVVLATTF